MKTDNELSHPIRLVFANNLRKIRRLKDISQESLALEAEISRVYLSEIERGKRAVSIDVMGKIADTLGIELSELVKNDLSIDSVMQAKQK